jgi:acyl-CoA thioester hydrolase
MSEPERHRVDVEVRYAETDQMGVVHHSRYLVWFELARTSLCRASGFHYADVERLGYYLMVTGAALSYRQGARYGDTVAVECWVRELASRSLGFAYEVRRDGERLVTGTTDHVWVDRARGRPCRIPEPLRAPFARLAGRAAPPAP